ncbi:MFS transporter [Mariniluteicoccus endophyticus]
MFASLSVPNYRAYAAGVVVSNTGMWMSRTAQSWLVLMVLTHHDSQALGMVTGLQFLPVLLLSTWAGSLADRFAKRHIMLVTQSVMGLNALVLGLLVVTGHATLPLVYLCTLIEGSASAIDAPARQSFVSEMVPPKRLSNAISLNSAMFNAARLFGPGVAGVLIAFGGTGPVFLINAATFAVFLVALLRLDRSELTPAPRQTGKGRVREGLRYVRSRPDIMLIMAIAFMMGTFGFNFQMTNVLMATEVYGRGAAEYGVLGSIMAIGSLTAALLSARRERPRLRHLLIALAAFVVSSALGAASPTFLGFCIMLVPIGLSAISVSVTANALVQSRVDAEVRGRVMALYMLLFLGGTPLGAPVIGWIGENFGARWTIWIGSAFVGVTLVVAMAYLWRTERLTLRVARGGRRLPRFRFVRGEVDEPEPQKFA